MTSTASPYSPDSASSATGSTDSGHARSDYTDPGSARPGSADSDYRQNDYRQPGYGYPPRPQQGAYPTPFGEKTLSYVSFWLGIASVVLSPTVLVPVAAIVLGFMARTREPAGRTWATWGIVLGFVMAFGWLVALVVGGVAALAALPFLAFL
jgi:hypothetical protein